MLAIDLSNQIFNIIKFIKMKKVKSNVSDFQQKLDKSQLVKKLMMKNLKGGAIGCPPPLGVKRNG